MDDLTYSELYQLYWDGNINWEQERTKRGYQSKEQLRSKFRREKRRRGDPMRTDVVASGVKEGNQPLVAILDIETLPGIGYFWGMWDQNIHQEMIIEDVSFLSWSGKYVGSDKVYSDILTPDEAINRDDSRIVKSVYEFMKPVQCLVGHNFRSFDYKYLNTFFLMNGMKPLRHRLIDTLEIAKQNFHFTSNKLKFINEKLGIREKISNEGFMLWRKCAEGDQEALDEMSNYDEGDVLATEELFWRLFPYINNSLPNLATYDFEKNIPTCSCGCIDFMQEGYWFTNQARYEKFRCNKCGSLVRGKKNLLSKAKKDSVLIRL